MLILAKRNDILILVSSVGNVGSSFECNLPLNLLGIRAIHQFAPQESQHIEQKEVQPFLVRELCYLQLHNNHEVHNDAPKIIVRLDYKRFRPHFTYYNTIFSNVDVRSDNSSIDY